MVAHIVAEGVEVGNKAMYYFDYNATTPVAKEVLTEMLPYFSEKYGNASSKLHAMGWQASVALEKAKERVAHFLQCAPEELVFNSGSTEGINQALQSLWTRYQPHKNHFITTPIEHSAVLRSLERLAQQGAIIDFVEVDTNGRVIPEHLQALLKPTTIAVCIGLANNEIGTIQDHIRSLADLIHQQQSILLSDTTQAFGKMEVNCRALGIDIAFLSAHKMYGPKGAGALYYSRRNPRISLLPLLVGGGQENGLRSGTENIPAIVGLGKACEIASNNGTELTFKLERLRYHFEQAIQQQQLGIVVAEATQRLCNTSSIRFHTITGQKLVKELGNQFAFSIGAACSSSLNKHSHVLKAIRFTEAECEKTVRFSFGQMNTIEEIDLLIKQLIAFHTTGI